MYKELLANNTFARTNEFGSYIWQNEYFPEEKINEYELTMYICDGRTFIRDTEMHVQRAYTLEEIKNAAELAGLKWISAVDADTDEETDNESERYLIILQEEGK